MRKLLRVRIEEKDWGMPVGLMSFEDYTKQLGELPILKLAAEARVVRIEGKVGAPTVVLEIPNGDIEVINHGTGSEK